MNSRIVIALGGNALGSTPIQQIENVKSAVPHIADMICKGHKVILTHGNGPQVGMINLAFEKGAQKKQEIPQIGLPECSAMSQGYIGYHLKTGIQNELKKRGVNKEAVALITQVEVNKDDPAFATPTKPIGNYYTEEQVKTLKKENPFFTYMEIPKRGYRKTVASPEPIDILEKNSILKLFDSGFIVIACGGGGVPVIKTKNGEYAGIDAVIDKDFSSAVLADLIGADYLMMLTSIPKVYLNFGKENQEEIKEMSADIAQTYCNEGQFGKGSMLPKVQAAIKFIKGKKNRKAFICSLEKVTDAINAKDGTIIY